MRHRPEPNEIYRHFKGNSYKIIALAKDAESGRDVVVYQALYGRFQVYVRSLDGFMSRVDKKKYPDAQQEYRFVPATDIIDSISQKKAETNREPIFHTLERSESKKAEPEETVKLDPLLLKFLEDRTYKEKLDDLSDMHKKITHDMINVMAASLEVKVGEGELEDRYQELKNCLLTFEKYECSRLR